MTSRSGIENPAEPLRRAMAAYQSSVPRPRSQRAGREGRTAIATRLLDRSTRPGVLSSPDRVAGRTCSHPAFARWKEERH